MRRRPLAEAEAGRETDGPRATREGDLHGSFALRHPKTNAPLRVISGGGEALWLAEGMPPPCWEHVSVSLKTRCPTWEEMDWTRGLFWLPEETVVQLHVPRSRHRNIHPFTLHLWRRPDAEHPLPPPECV